MPRMSPISPGTVRTADFLSFPGHPGEKPGRSQCRDNP